MPSIATLPIILIIAFILLYGLFFYATIRVGIGKRDTLSWITIGVVALIGLLLITYLIANIANIVPADWAQILILLGLVAVTAMYAWSTRKQADASMKMAEEMQQTRLDEAKPYLLLRLTERVVQWNNGPDLREHRPLSFMITIINAGKGPAIDLCTALWKNRESCYAFERKGYLVPGEEWQAEIHRFEALTEKKEAWLPQLRNIVGQNETEIIAVEYKDIHKRTWISYFYLEKHKQNSAFVVAGEQNTMELKVK